MLAHTIYPAIDPDEVSTVSKKVVTGLLREKLGFAGVITTDSMTMAGIAGRYGVPEACALTLEAGSDLVLMKAQNELVDQTFHAIKSFVENGRIPEADLDAKVTRVLGMKYDIGLFDADAGREQPDALVADASIKELEQEVARKSCVIMKRENHALPLKPDQRFLLVEQVTTERNNAWQHPCAMFKEALRHNRKLAFCETGFSADAEDQERINALVPGFDTVVLTNFQDRAMKGSTEFLNDLVGRHPDKTFILVTNKPYSYAIPENAGTVICTFSKAPQSLKAAVDLLFGHFEATGQLPGNATGGDGTPA
jgi:beta-N-acetylhexosaminidase